MKGMEIRQNILNFQIVLKNVLSIQKSVLLKKTTKNTTLRVYQFWL